MARKRKRGPGRPPNKNRAIVTRLVLSLDPIEHAGLISKLMAAPPRGRAAIAIDLMTNGLPIDAPTVAMHSIQIDSSIDDL